MIMILCITPNPAVDRTLTVPGIRLGEVSRAAHALVAAGGKGLNVARVARAFGAEARCAGFLGGHSGRLVAELAGREGLCGGWTWIDGETRTCVIIVDPRGGEATVINEVGPEVTPEDWARLTAQVLREAETAEHVCLSGSLPPGSTTESYATLLRGLRDAGRTVWVDTSGVALAAALTVETVGIKVNGAEAGAIVGWAIETTTDALTAARELHERTGAPVALTLGELGAVLVSETGSWHARPPALKIVSTVGSGDAFLAGLVVALAEGATEPEALRRAVAAGAANARSIGGGRFDLDEFNAILSQTRINGG